MGTRYLACRLASSDYQRIRAAIEAAVRGQLETLHAIVGDKGMDGVRVTRHKRFVFFGPQVVVVQCLDHAFMAAVEATAIASEPVEKLPDRLAHALSFDLVYGPARELPKGLELNDVSAGILPPIERRALESKLIDAELAAEDAEDVARLRPFLAAFADDDYLVWIGT